MRETVIERVPGPAGLPFFGHIFEAWSDALGLMARGHASHGDVVRFYFGPRQYFLLTDPAAIHRVLIENRDNYPKSRNYKGLKLVLGKGLLTSEGELWKRQRKLASPAFHRRCLAGFAESMARCTREMLDEWDARPDGVRVDIHEEMMRLTFRIVGWTLCSTELGGDAQRLGDSISFVMKYANDYAEAILPISPTVPTPTNLRFRRHMRDLDEMIHRIIAERRASGEVKPDLLQMLMDATDDDSHEGMDDGQLRDELLTLVLAGHETTANALSFAFYLLSKHPDVARAVAREADEAFGATGPTFDNVKELELTGRVVDETLRLYPPAWVFEREAIEADVLAGYRIPADGIIGISPYTLHRHPELWENPEGFDPARFTKERAAARHKYQYLPFGGGPRTCIGNHFALLEAKLILAEVSRRYRVDLVPGARLELEPGITLRARGGIRMALRRRGAEAARGQSAQRQDRPTA